MAPSRSRYRFVCGWVAEIREARYLLLQFLLIR